MIVCVGVSTNIDSGYEKANISSCPWNMVRPSMEGVILPKQI